MVECFKQASVKKLLDWLVLPNASIVGKEIRIGSFQKFVETKRIEVKQIDHSDRIRLGLSQKRSQKTAGSHHVIVVCFFLEIFERIECCRALLNLVKDDECVTRQDFLACDQRQQLNDTVRIFVHFENGG